MDATGWGLPGRNAVAVISYGLWQQLFGGDAKALGATVRIDGNPLTVIGVRRRDSIFRIRRLSGNQQRLAPATTVGAQSRISGQMFRGPRRVLPLPLKRSVFAKTGRSRRFAPEHGAASGCTRRPGEECFAHVLGCGDIGSADRVHECREHPDRSDSRSHLGIFHTLRPGSKWRPPCTTIVHREPAAFFGRHSRRIRDHLLDNLSCGEGQAPFQPLQHNPIQSWMHVFWRSQ